jgi:hypothetical protein
MKLTRAMKRVTGRLTTMRRVTGQLNGREEGQWSADDLEAAGHLVHFSLFSKKSEDSLPPILLKDNAMDSRLLYPNYCKDKLIFFKNNII